MPVIGRVFGADLANLRAGALGNVRPGAAEISDVALRSSTLDQASADAARVRIMEAAFEAIRNQPGFDPNVAGSASFKLRW